MLSLLLPFIIFNFISPSRGLCGDSIRWSHRVNIDEVYGVWYGVGHAQHNPDMTNLPNEIGCVTLHISDATDEYQDWYHWSLLRRNYTDQNWRSTKSNPWSQDSMAGSWLDIRLKRKVKRNIDSGEKRVRVHWDEDGHTIEQIYVYYPDEPGLWTADKLRPMEREMMSRGIDIYTPDEPPRHPDVIRLLNVTTHTLVLNHCSEIGNGGIFSLILRRSPSRVQRWEWYKYQKELYKYDLPKVFRYSAVCSACTQFVSVFMFISILSLQILFK